jgi:hypothetical protein
MTDSAAEADGHALCIACGACCSGAWHPFINLQPGEEKPARRHGMTIVEVKGAPRAKLPCPLYKNGCCSVYDQWRPASCGGYRCKLLDDVTQRQMPLAEALGHVRAVRGMIERIRAEVPDLPAGMLGVQFLKRIGGDDAPGAPALDISEAARLDGVALNMYYMKYFRPPRPLVADSDEPEASAGLAPR